MWSFIISNHAICSSENEPSLIVEPFLKPLIDGIFIRFKRCGIVNCKPNQQDDVRQQLVWSRSLNFQLIQLLVRPP